MNLVFETKASKEKNAEESKVNDKKVGRNENVLAAQERNINIAVEMFSYFNFLKACKALALASS